MFFTHHTNDLSRSTPSRHFIALRWILALLVFGVAQASAIPTSWSCADAIPYEVGQPIEWVADSNGSSALLSLDVGSSGRLALEVQDLGDNASAWLQLVPGRCDAADASKARGQSYLERGLFEIARPGPVLVRVGRTTTEPMASTLRLSSRLLAAEPWREKDGEPGDDTGEEDIETVPVLYPGGGCALEQLPTWDRIAAFEKDGDPGDDTGEEDIETVPVVIGPDSCRATCAGVEPANDLLYCAQPLDAGGHVKEQLAAFDGLDRDYYTFQLDGLRTVRVEATSDFGSRTLLLDSHGRTLATSDLSTSGVLEATLAAGRYFLRVEGEGEGEYRLKLSSSEY